MYYGHGYGHGKVRCSTNLISMIGITNMITLGDSITVGQNASPSSNAYKELIQSFYGITETTYALGGIGVWYNMNQFKSATYTRSTTLLSVMLGLNDLRRGGSASKTREKIKAGIRYFLYKHFTKSNAPTGSSSVTRSGGTFAANNGFVSLGGQYSGTAIPGASTAARSETINNYYEYTFTEDNVGFIFFANDGVTNTQDYGTFEVYIDNILIETINSKGIYTDGISDGTYDNARVPIPIWYSDIGSGTHAIKIIHKTGTYVIIENFYHLLSPSACGPAALFEVPYLNSTGYSLSPSSGSQSISDTISSDINSICSTYRMLGYPITYIPTNSYYNLSTGIDSDNIHPNNIGHSQIFSAFQTRIK